MRLHTRDRSASVSSVQAAIPAAVKQAPIPAPVIEKLPVKPGVLPSSLAANTPPLLILYGSNTGTSEEAAYQLAHLAQKEGFKTSAIAPLDSYVDKLGHDPVPLLVIVTATYNGKPPDNAAKFDKWMDEAAVTCPHMLKGTSFAVFGIGNSQWQSYQAFPNKVDTKLTQLGATRLYARGAGDIDKDYEEAFIDWKPRLFQTLRSIYTDTSAPMQFGFAEERVFTSNVKIEYQSDDALEDAHVSSIAEARCCQVLASRELQTNGSDRHTRHLEFALPDDVTYTTGDHLGVCPVNAQSLVEAMATRLRVDPKKKVRLSLQDTSFVSRKSTLPLDAVTTIQEILARFVDLNVAPSRPALKAFSQYCADGDQKSRLALLANPDPEGIEAYKTYFSKLRKTIIDVLMDFPAINVPLDVFLDVSPKLQPRFYSISSSNAMLPHVAHLTVGLVDEELPVANKHYLGVCSSYLNGLKAGDKAFIFVQDTQTTFRVPSDPSTTMIMICAGTGLAPFRGFLQERKHVKETQGHVGKSYLFFGCRRPEYDYLYQDELAQFKAEGVLTDAFVAFSRKVPTKKEYVQDKLLEQKELVWELIKDSDPKKCIVYVCGSARGMAKDVRNTFSKIGEDLLPEQIAQRFVAALQEKGAYLEDVWG
jgi:cytochrome P450/NADPH-cytochrome P450 reductase